MPKPKTERRDALTLRFAAKDELAHVDDPIHRDVSAIAVTGRTLFAACDETASVERLIFNEDGTGFSAHESFPLGKIFDLPDDADGEMDIEGLEIQDGWLWVTGSHSLKRDDPGSKGLAGLDDIDWDENRSFLGRVPLIDRGNGVFEPVGTIEVMGGETRRARSLSMKEEEGVVRNLLRDDPLIGPFVDLPCKENGLDVEGLAAHGDTVWLGLRGPVVGAYAMIVEMTLKEKRSKPRRLKPKKYEGGLRYKLYAIDLEGQAIRDLLYCDGTMFVLSGATTDLEAMQSVHRIKNWPPENEVLLAKQSERVIDLPVIRGSDHAEGIAMAEFGDKQQMLIAFDSPDESRIEDKTQSIDVDVFDLPGVTRARPKAAGKPAPKKKAA